MNRRQFLRFAGGAALTASGFLKAGCAPVTTRINPGTGLSLCPVTGDVDAEQAVVWLRAEAGSEVALQYGTDPALRQFSLTGSSPVDPQRDNTAQIALEKLRPATRYYYRPIVAGKNPGPVSSFVTAPRADDEAKVSFCFSGDTRETYKPFTIMGAIEAQRPDFFLYLGDTIYADLNGAARRLPEFWAKYRANREDLWMQSCLCRTSVYVTWDDHEVQDNYLPENPLAPIGRRAFLDYWPIRRPAAEPEKVYRSFRWGKALELFVLDARQYRDLKTGTMLGKAQKEWLFDGLSRSEATFKFIATTVPMAGGGRDRWDGFPRERQEILRFIARNKIRGVYFLSADMHFAAMTQIPHGGGLKDITAGPMAAPLNRITDGTAKRFEFFLAENFNFGKITVDPKNRPNQALLEFIDQDHRVFYRAQLSAV